MWYLASSWNGYSTARVPTSALWPTNGLWAFATGPRKQQASTCTHIPTCASNRQAHECTVRLHERCRTIFSPPPLPVHKAGKVRELCSTVCNLIQSKWEYSQLFSPCPKISIEGAEELVLRSMFFLGLSLDCLVWERKFPLEDDVRLRYRKLK